MVFDSFKHALSDFAQLKSVIKAQYPRINIVDPAGNIVVNDDPKTAPDHVLVQGIL